MQLGTQCDLSAIAAAAKDRGIRVATAESVTAGRIAGRLATGPDAIDWFVGGIVCYSSALKHDLLGVPPGTVWVAVAGTGPAQTQVHRFRGSPDHVIEDATAAALRLLRRRVAPALVRTVGAAH
jgi:nicotinamide mononucleotide (NMN) deamidase PncC